MKEWLEKLWSNHKKKIIIAGIVIVAAIVIFGYGCRVGMGCQ